ncbi:MAG: 3-deoxy-D-manno-octulosonic acid transferase [Pseudorhodobacter sp.]
MAHQLGLTLYNLINRTELQSPLQRAVRPRGLLVWLHAPSMESRAPMEGIARRLKEEDGISSLLTYGAHIPAPAIPMGGFIEPVPPDNTSMVREFLDHWHPDIAIFAEGELRPALLNETRSRNIPHILVEGRAPAFPAGRSGWWPGLMRSLLEEFSGIFTIDDNAARAFRRAGALRKCVKITGRLEYPARPLPYIEAERAELATLFSARPIWFAADLPEAEEALVIAAHRAALKLRHRLLLILAPREPARIDILTQRMMDDEGWAVARRMAEEDPDADHQVYVAEPGLEFGLWYRLAPITWLGGSLSADGAGRDPMEAAALGSALIHGPHAGAFGPALGRLAGAQATALATSAEDLADLLGELLSPDRSARQAKAAWDVVSEGAEATDEVLVMIRNLLDRAF